MLRRTGESLGVGTHNGNIKLGAVFYFSVIAIFIFLFQEKPDRKARFALFS